MMRWMTEPCSLVNQETLLAPAEYLLGKFVTEPLRLRLSEYLLLGNFVLRVYVLC